MDEAILKALLETNQRIAAAMEGGNSMGRMVTRGVTGTPTVTYQHGPGGLFSQAGIEDMVINASLSPRGIDSVLPIFPTVYTNPLYPFITGFESDGSAEPSGVCDNCPGGIIQNCYQTAVFGRVCRESQEIEINRVMQLVNRGETNELRVLGSVLMAGGIQPPRSTMINDWINYTTQTQMVIVGIEFQRALSQMIWTGNPANNSAGGGYAEFPGLDMLIATGKVDAVSGVACGALDPDVKDFNYNDVCGASPDIVEYISMMHFYLSHVADRTALSPVQWVIAMRPQLFFELTACWPCKYLTNRCADAAGANAVVINDDGNVAMRDAMRNGSYLIVNGVQLPVVTDDGIFEENSTNSANVNPGEFASDIYFIPITARGIPVTYWEHLDYTGAAPDEAMLNGRQDWWSTDGGRYMWTVEQQAWCYVIMGKIEPRIVLRTPHLAGRIQNVMYTPLQHLREPFEDSPYWVKGGSPSAPLPQYYSEWNPLGR